MRSSRFLPRRAGRVRKSWWARNDLELESNFRALSLYVPLKLFARVAQLGRK